MTQLLVLGTADWNQAIATNQHYVVKELARERSLTFVESMGLRAPELSIRDIRRAGRRLSSRPSNSRNGTRAIPEGVHVISPKALPRHVGLSRRFNFQVVRRFARDWASSSELKVLWTYTPVTYGLEQIADVVIYHCVDLLGKVDGISEPLISASERHLATHTDTTIGTSGMVVDHLESVGFSQVITWPNVADTEVIAHQRPSEVVRVPKRAIFAGNLSTTKIDFPLLRLIVESGVDLHLAGPIAEGGGSASTHVRDLVRAGATHHGMLSLEELASLYWTAQVGLIPYSLNPYTFGVSPLKTYEYLASGLAVVSTALPSMSAIQDDVLISADHSTFVSALDSVFKSSDPQRFDRRIAHAQEHSWLRRGQDARNLISDLEARHDDH